MKISLVQTEVTFNEGSVALIQILADQKYDNDIQVGLLLTGAAGRFQTVPLFVTIPKGTLSVPVVLQTINDNLYQGPQDFTFSISSADQSVNASPASMIIHLIDDDAPPTVQWTATSQTVSEGAGTATVTAQLSAISGVDTSIPFTLSGTATQGSDYSVATNTINIAAGTTTGTLTVSIIDDSAIEATESIILSLGTPTHATLAGNTIHTISIFDNEGPDASFSLATQNFNESNGALGNWDSNLGNWTRRRKIDLTGVSTVQTNIPIMIKLNSSRIDYGQTQNSGQDLRFVSAGGTVLPYEIENWDEAGTSIVWVKVPTLSASPTLTSIWMYYGNVSAPAGEDRVNTWDSNHKAVWHLSGGLNDSTANAVTGTTNGATSVAGKVSTGYNFNGTSHEMDMGTTNSLDIVDELTVEGWIKAGATMTDNKIASRQSSMNQGYKLGVNANKLEFEIRGVNGPILNRAVTGGTSLVAGTWYHVAGTYSRTGGYIRTFINGALDRQLNTAEILVGGSTNFYLGREGTSALYWFQGVLDEFRVSNVARSSDWLKASYNSSTDNMAFFRNEETSSSTPVNVTINLSFSSTNNVTIPYTVSGTASNPSDHNLSSGSLVMPAGSTSGTISFTVNRDVAVEGNETVILTLGTPTNAFVGAISSHTVTIIDEVNTAPVAVNDTIIITSSGPTLIDVISNDSDANADSLALTSISSPSSGLSTAVANGQSILFTPGTTFPGSETFTYSIDDGRGGTATATVTINYQIPFTWIGAGANANWTTVANWQGGVAPGASNIAYFNNQCTTWCSPIINASSSVAAVRMDSSFTGTITQGAGFTFSVATSGSWIQRNGAFVGSAANITIGSLATFDLLGGTFTSTSGSLIFRGNAINIANSGNFIHNSGTVQFGTGVILDAAGSTINSTNGWNLFKLLSSHYSTLNVTMTAGSSIIVNSDLTFSDWTTHRWNTSNIHAKGDLYFNSSGFRNTDLVITIDGTANQTIYGNGSSAPLPSVIINKPSGTLFLNGTVAFGGDLTYTAGAFDAGTSTATLGTNIYEDGSITFNTGSMHFYNFKVMNYSSYRTSIIVGTLYVDGDLAFEGGSGGGQNFSGGNIEVKGNVAFTSGDYMYYDSATTGITFTGTANQTVSSAGGTPPPGTWTIDKGAGTVSLAANINLYKNYGLDLNVVSGALNMAGFNLNINRNITNSGTIQLGASGSCGVLTQGGTYSGNATICP
jgi:hypothetical protein